MSLVYRLAPSAALSVGTRSSCQRRRSVVAALATVAALAALAQPLSAQDLNWSPLAGATPGGANAGVTALTVFDDGTGPALYAGGAFWRMGGLSANGVAKWDGERWTALSGSGGNGVNGIVYALTVFDDGNGPALFAADFTTAGGRPANKIAKWNGRDWSALSGPGGNGVSGDAGYVLSVGGIR